MRKKIFLFIFSLIVAFTFFENLYALEQKICTYHLTSKHTTITLNIVDGKMEKEAHYLREKPNKDNRMINLENGQEALEGSSFVGDTYYSKYKKCPPYIFLVSSNTGKRLFLSDKNLKGSTELVKAIKKKYTTLDEGYPFEIPLMGSDEDKEDEKKYYDSFSASCMNLETEKECKRGFKGEEKDAEVKFECVWVINEFKESGYCNVNDIVYVTCGNSYDIPYEAPKIISFVVYLLKIGTPIILIFFSIIPLVKALASSNEDELKKAQKSLVKKLIAGALVFFVVSIVQFVIMKVADISETNNISDCFDCFLNYNCESTAYYKTSVGGTYLCNDFSNSDDEFTCPQYSHEEKYNKDRINKSEDSE